VVRLVFKTTIASPLLSDGAAPISMYRHRSGHAFAQLEFVLETQASRLFFPEDIC
jgi:hypothetical protein